MPEFVKLIQKIQYITLEQFIPNWTEVIEEMDKKNILGIIRHDYALEKGLNYSNTKFCLVGESHHNNRDYSQGCMGEDGCPTCFTFAIHPANDAIEHGKETFQNFKLELFTHMLEAHTELMIKHG